MKQVTRKVLNKIMLNAITKTEKYESLALVDFIGLRTCFVIQNRCPPRLKLEVGGKQPVNYCVRKGYEPNHWWTYRV